MWSRPSWPLQCLLRCCAILKKSSTVNLFELRSKIVVGNSNLLRFRTAWYIFLSPFEHCIRPNLGPVRKSNIFSVFAVYVTHKFITYFGIFCSWKGDKNKTELASILLNRPAVLKTVKDSPCRLVHHRLSTARLFIRIVACPVLSFYRRNINSFLTAYDNYTVLLHMTVGGRLV